MNIEWMKQVQEVYRMLEDEESRDIYMKRLSYLMTGEFSYIEKIADIYLPQFKGRARDADLYALIKKEHPDKDIILYGAGLSGNRCLSYWRNVKEFQGFCDRDIKKQLEGVNTVGGVCVKVISPEELLCRDETVVVISIENSRFEKEIKNFLINKGFPEEKIYSRCKYVLDYAGTDAYFDKDIIRFEEDEIFVDAGSLNLDTSLELKRRCPNLKKVYAFEPDNRSYQGCIDKKMRKKLDFIEVFPYGVWSEKKQIHFDATSDGSSHLAEGGSSVVDVVTIDEMVKEKVTFIKMDIEGAELEALKGAKQVIREYRPKLAICIYHKAEDMLAIPFYIRELVPNYKLYIRHYSTTWYDTVLYAI